MYVSRKNYSKGYIYKILNTKNNKVYIGSTINFELRKRTHIRTLNSDTHFNRYLQNSWNKYGESAFIFEIIECTLNTDILIAREQFYMDSYKSYNRNIGYNINKLADSSLGRRVSEETKEKIRQKHLKANRKGVNSHQWGRKHTKETKDKISKIHKGKSVDTDIRKNMSMAHLGTGQGSKNTMAKLSDEQVIEIKLLWKYGHISSIDIANYYSITKSAIDGIIHEGKWSHINIDEYTSLPIKLKELLEHNEIRNLLRNKKGLKRAILTWTMLKDLIVLLENSELSTKQLSEIFCVNTSAINSIKRKASFKKDIDDIMMKLTGKENCMEIIKKYRLYDILINSNEAEYN